MTFPVLTVTQTFRQMPVVELSETDSKCETFPISLTFRLIVFCSKSAQPAEQIGG